MKDWTEFGLRTLPVMSARARVSHVPPIQGLIDALIADSNAELTEPLRGVTSDGVLIPGLRRKMTGHVDTAQILHAANAFLAALSRDERAKATLPFDSPHWRSWSNVHMNFFRHGVMLDDLNVDQRGLAIALIGSTLSTRGAAQIRDIMRLNEVLAIASASRDEFGEWLYFVTVFGSPSETEAWGWQFDGHHANVNCLVLGDRIVVTPTFMGSEPCSVRTGEFAGIRVFAREEQAGLNVIRSLDAKQREAAILYPSIMPGELPPHLEHWIDGRMQAGAFKDNVVLPYQGLPGASMSAAQKKLLLSTLDQYVGWIRHEHSATWSAEIDSHLDETWFSWFGGAGDHDPFYYRIQSPVVLVEFDHHPGVVFDNVEPSRHHVHTILRTPNGGDYGADLLAQHYAESNH